MGTNRKIINSHNRTEMFKILFFGGKTMNFNKIVSSIKANEAIGNVIGQAIGAGLVGVGSLVIQKWVAKSQIKNLETQTKVLEFDARQKYGPDWDKKIDPERAKEDSKTETKEEKE